MKKPYVLTVFSGSFKIENTLKEMGVPFYEKKTVMSNGFYGTRFEIPPFYGKGSREKNKKLFELCYP